MMKLNEYFEETGVMKAFFAKKIGTTPTSLQSWLKGKTKPKIDLVLKIEKQTNGFVKAKDWITEEKATH